ncbi:MAG TPA: SDR family NAD(P)-dependent oxidoreductase [Burkholderiales bacterium]|nr:SDR family NAD(P)-dependent oxidoreductase [Burkholderiales bacterium]
MAGQLAGKVALITGAVRRGGRASAHALAREGASIVINTRRSLDEAEKVRGEIEAMGGQALVCLADITDEAAVARMFGEAVTRFGRLDILVNNAADRGIVPFEKMTLPQWRHIVGIALDGTFLCTRAAVPHMLKGGWGRIVNISGVSHYAPSYSGRAHVSAAKAGVEGFTRALAAEYAGRNITVNCVCPGRVGGERSASSSELPDPSLMPPVGHLGVPEDIAGAVHYFCLPGSSFVTGHTMHVNGGQVLL